LPRPLQEYVLKAGMDQLLRAAKNNAKTVTTRRRRRRAKAKSA
jgi:hypothetical protein